MVQDLEARRRTAIHEAGHAVAAYFHGRQFRHVTIVEDEDTYGHCLYEPDPDDFHPDYSTNDDTFERIREHVVSALAGQVAEDVICGSDGQQYIGASHDYRMAVNMADYAVGSVRALEAFLAWLLVETEELVAMPHVRRAIETLAVALLERETLTQDEAAPIIDAAMAQH